MLLHSLRERSLGREHVLVTTFYKFVVSLTTILDEETVTAETLPTFSKWQYAFYLDKPSTFFAWPWWLYFRYFFQLTTSKHNLSQLLHNMVFYYFHQ